METSLLSNLQESLWYLLSENLDTPSRLSYLNAAVAYMLLRRLEAPMSFEEIRRYENLFSGTNEVNSNFLGDKYLQHLTGWSGVENAKREAFNDTQLADFEADSLYKIEEEIHQDLHVYSRADFNEEDIGIKVEGNHVVALKINYPEDHPLKVFPEAINHLSQLRVLMINDSDLSAIPEGIVHLTSLEILDLRGNQISALPQSFGQLGTLKELYIGANQLSNLPVTMGGLTNLEVLSLEENALKSIPPEIQALKSLKLLDLTNNQLETLPSWLRHLTSLEELYVSGNRLRITPEEKATIRYLSANGCRIFGFEAK